MQSCDYDEEKDMSKNDLLKRGFDHVISVHAKLLIVGVRWADLFDLVGGDAFLGSRPNRGQCPVGHKGEILFVNMSVHLSIHTSPRLAPAAQR